MLLVADAEAVTDAGTEGEGVRDGVMEITGVTEIVTDTLEVTVNDKEGVRTALVDFEADGL